MVGKYELSPEQAFQLARALVEASAIASAHILSKGISMTKKAAAAKKPSPKKPTTQKVVVNTKGPKKNKLYFNETVLDGGKRQYGWTVRSSNGKIVGSSSELYSKKVYAIKNALNLFGWEIANGVHVIQDEDSSKQVFEELKKQAAKS